MILPGPFSSASQRVHRFGGPPELLLQNLPQGELYVHARNFLCELAAFTPLGEPVFDSTEQCVIYPEKSLAVSLAAVRGIHGLVIDHGISPSLALEFALHGESRALCIAAIPRHSDMESFAAVLLQPPYEEISETDFNQWRDLNQHRPSICPCCASATKKRRKHADKHLFSRIFEHAIEEGLSFRCGLRSPGLGFSTWLAPGELKFDSGMLGVVSRDQRSILQIDPGFVHSLRLHSTRIDDEWFSVAETYDSLGNLHFTLAAPDPLLGEHWRRLAGSCG